MCDENDLDEREQKALLAALQRRAEIDEKRGHATMPKRAPAPIAAGSPEGRAFSTASQRLRRQGLDG